MVTTKLLKAAIEACHAHGNTVMIRAWYQTYTPEYYQVWGLGTTVQYSLSCNFMENVAKYLEDGGVLKPGRCKPNERIR